MFQFSDMGEDPIVDPEEISRRAPPALQPEEEPTRRASNIEVPEMSLETPVETPIPNDNFESDHAGSSYEPSLAPSNPAEGGENMGENSHVSFGEASSVGESQGENSVAHHVATTDNVVHDACIVESVPDGPVLQGDEDTLWTDAIDQSLDHCSFEFEMPWQLMERVSHQPKTHAVLLTTAAKKSRAEVRYSALSSEENQLFDRAIAKELRCWLETSTVKRIRGIAYTLTES
jgi:hypothetical protein